VKGGTRDGERAQEAGERAAIATVAAVRGQILRDEVQLQDAVAGEPLRLVEEVVHRSALVTPADRGDDAEAATVVAALGDLEVRGPPRAEPHPLRELAVREDVLCAAVDDRAVGSGPLHRVADAEQVAG